MNKSFRSGFEKTADLGAFVRKNAPVLLGTGLGALVGQLNHARKRDMYESQGFQYRPRSIYSEHPVLSGALVGTGLGAMGMMALNHANEALGNKLNAFNEALDKKIVGLKDSPLVSGKVDITHKFRMPWQK